jgi:phage terminase large subunit-like protein
MLMLSTIIALLFLGVGASCLIECFDTEEYDQQPTHTVHAGGCDTRDARI